MLEIIASFNLESLEIEDDLIERVQKALRKNKLTGSRGRATLLGFFYEVVSRAYLEDRGAKYLINLALLTHALVKNSKKFVDVKKIANLVS